MNANVRTDLLRYPVLRLSKGMVFPARNAEELTQCTVTAMRNGFFNGLILIDSAGKKFRISGARKLRGVGPLFGFNVFLNRKIEVALTAAGPEESVDTEEVRRLVLGALRGKQAWSSADDSDELLARVEQAQSVSKIADAVTVAYYRSMRKQ
jgi:hypothetical protein